MKFLHVVVAVAVLALGVGWTQECAGRAAERKLREIAYESYVDVTKKLTDSIATLTRAGAVLARQYAVLKARAPAAAETVRVALVRGDTMAGLAALDAILRAGQACDAALSNCSQRVALERRRGNHAAAMVDTLRVWYQAEIRRGRAWSPFSLKPPSLPWTAGLLLIGGVLLP